MDYARPQNKKFFKNRKVLIAAGAIALLVGAIGTLGATTLLLTCPRFTDGVAQFHRASVLSTSNSAACVWAPLSKPSLAASNKVQFSVSNLAPNTGYQVFV